MSDRQTSIRERYFALLYEYVEAPDERLLAQAADLGREMIASGFPIEQIAEIQHEANAGLAQKMPRALFSELAPILCIPLIELLVAFSLEFRKNAAEKDRIATALRGAVLEWRRTVDSVDYLILLLDKNGRIIRTNEATRRRSNRLGPRLSMSPVERLGNEQPWESIVELVQSLKEIRATRSVRIEDERADKTWDITATYSTAENEEDYIVVVARDVTEQVKMEQSLRRSELLSKMGSVLGDFAHEVRNPIFSISATIDAFEARFGDEELFGEYFKVLRGEIARTNKLMKQLLEYGKPSRSEFVVGDLGEVVVDAIRSCSYKAVEAKVSITNNLEGETAPMRMDRVRLGQAFENVLVNAIEHSPPAGAIVIDCTRVREREKNWLVFTVSDTGNGFGEQDVAQIFEPFFSRRKGGTGLGLSIVRRAVEDHGGQVSAGNRPGGGAVVTIRLPRDI